MPVGKARATSGGDGRSDVVHGDPFPLPVPSVPRRDLRDLPRYLQQRLKLADARDARIAEAAVTLNRLASSKTGGAGPVPKPSARNHPLSSSQASAKDEIASKISRVGHDPVARDDREALCELLKCKDLYGMDAHTVVPFVESKVKVLQGLAPARPLEERLTGDASSIYKKW